MLDKDKLNLYDGEYQPEPFKFAGNAKTAGVLVAIGVGVVTTIILGNTIFGNAQENDIEGILNLAVSIGVGILMYFGAEGFARMAYKKKVAEERAEFEKMKQEAIPYTVCEFCSGRIEKKYYKTRDVNTLGLKVGDVTENGIESYTCAECGYWVDCHTYDQYVTDTMRLRYFALVVPKIVEGSPMEEEKVKRGRLMSYLDKRNEHPEAIVTKQ